MQRAAYFFVRQLDSAFSWLCSYYVFVITIMTVNCEHSKSVLITGDLRRFINLLKLSATS